jgi:hypothetical protein
VVNGRILALGILGLEERRSRIVGVYEESGIVSLVILIVTDSVLKGVISLDSRKTDGFAHLLSSLVQSKEVGPLCNRSLGNQKYVVVIN